MKADDFRFPLPPESRVLPPIILSGGFDTVDGSVEVRFERSNPVTPIPGGLSIKFHYFGDK
jgi:hypothetical protein